MHKKLALCKQFQLISNQSDDARLSSDENEYQNSRGEQSKVSHEDRTAIWPLKDDMDTASPLPSTSKGVSKSSYANDYNQYVFADDECSEESDSEGSFTKENSKKRLKGKTRYEDGNRKSYVTNEILHEAHCDLFGSEDDDDSDDDSDYDMPDIEVPQPFSPTLSLEESLERIGQVQLDNQEDESDISQFLSEHDIGHINFIIQTYADVVLDTNIPEKVNSLTQMHHELHKYGLYHLIYVVTQCDHFLFLNTDDQILLLKANAIPMLIILGQKYYDNDKRKWVLNLSSESSFELSLDSLSPEISKETLNRIALFYDTLINLHIDWPMTLLLGMIIMYALPAGKNENIEVIRDKYVKTLLNYIKWKFGIKNSSILFVKYLRFLDVILKFRDELNSNLTSSLTDILALDM